MAADSAGAVVDRPQRGAGAAIGFSTVAKDPNRDGWTVIPAGKREAIRAFWGHLLPPRHRLGATSLETVRPRSHPPGFRADEGARRQLRPGFPHLSVFLFRSRRAA